MVGRQRQCAINRPLMKWDAPAPDRTASAGIAQVIGGVPIG